MTPPFELEIERMAHGGMGMGRHEGRVIFVPYVIPGERVRVEIAQDKQRFAHAIPLDILRPSPAREAPHCDHFGPGGGGPCTWQHIEYTHQLRYKREVVTEQLQRVGKFAEPVVHPIPESPAAWGYRMHITLNTSPDSQLGFRSDDHSHIVPVEVCYLMHPALVEMVAQLDLEVPEIERVRFQIGSEPDDRMIVIQTSDDLAPEIEVDFPVSVNLLLSDNEPINLIGSPQVSYQALDRTFRVTAGAFSYANMGMAPMLIAEVLRQLDLQGEESLLELYSGTGMLTPFLAQRADMVLSVESYPPAVTDAEHNTRDLENVELVEGPAEGVLDDLVGPFDMAVVDPPPTGLSVDVVDALARLSVPRIVYISADPATLARDAQRLVRQGYALGDVQPLDMDPQTPLVTCIATLERA